MSPDLQVTIRGLDGRPIVVTPGMLAGMPFFALQELRAVNQDDQLTQDLLANFEHRAFAREFVGSPDSPTIAPVRALAIGMATPAYSAMKATGTLPKFLMGEGLASTPSIEQVRQGMLGVGEGLKMNAKIYGQKARGMLGIER